MKKLVFFILTFFILSIMIVLAQPPIPGGEAGLSVPHHFWGSVTYNGQSAEDGLVVGAYIDNYLVMATLTLNGNYMMKVRDDDGHSVGKTVNFYVGDINTDQTYVFENGASTELNLDVSETTDNTNPPSDGSDDSSGGSSNGGSTGDSKVITCVEDWECKGWSVCKLDNTKSCFTWVDNNNCGTVKQSNIETCVYIGEVEEVEEEKLSIEDEEETKEIPVPTGAVVGTGEEVNKIWFVIALGIIVVLLLVFKFWKFKK